MSPLPAVLPTSPPAHPPRCGPSRPRNLFLDSIGTYPPNHQANCISERCLCIACKLTAVSEVQVWAKFRCRLLPRRAVFPRLVSKSRTILQNMPRYIAPHPSSHSTGIPSDSCTLVIILCAARIPYRLPANIHALPMGIALSRLA